MPVRPETRVTSAMQLILRIADDRLSPPAATTFVYAVPEL